MFTFNGRVVDSRLQSRSHGIPPSEARIMSRINIGKEKLSFTKQLGLQKQLISTEKKKESESYVDMQGADNQDISVVSKKTETENNNNYNDLNNEEKGCLLQ